MDILFQLSGSKVLHGEWNERIDVGRWESGAATSSAAHFRDVTGGVYKARERFHTLTPLLAIPAPALPVPSEAERSQPATGGRAERVMQSVADGNRTPSVRARRRPFSGFCSPSWVGNGL